MMSEAEFRAGIAGRSDDLIREVAALRAVGYPDPSAAARYSSQNIAEGSRASATSSQTELRLLNVARAGLEELLLDFEDYLRHRHLALWAADSPEARSVRTVARRARKTVR